MAPPNAQVIQKYITQDPGLPRQNPTSSYWQHVLHPLANTQSTALPDEVDVAVIGSGITGASVARTLLQKLPSDRIAVLEARSLCSGATGRNGGQLATNAGESYAESREKFGSDMAGKIAEFTLKTCERMREVIAQYAPEEGEYRDVTKVRAFLDEGSFRAMQESIKLMEAEHPALRGIYQILDGSTILERHGVHGAVGGVTLPAGAMWPYRVVTKIFEVLSTKHSDRFSIETNTPVSGVGYQDGKYTLHTPRGTIRAGRVIHCTNGYVGHLVPKLRGLMFPVRGTMTVQDLGPNVPNKGAKESFGFHYEPIYDEETKTLADGLWYLTQNARTGHFFFGGEKGTIDDTLTADDTTISDVSLKHLQDILPTFFNYKDVKEDSLVSAWSGIMCFTQDGAPYIGKLPQSVTDREGTEEWIVGGYGGYGMPYCWLAGEALANLVVGGDVSDWLPKQYLVAPERLSPSAVSKIAEVIASLH